MKICLLSFSRGLIGLTGLPRLPSPSLKHLDILRSLTLKIREIPQNSSCTHTHDAAHISWGWPCSLDQLPTLITTRCLISSISLQHSSSTAPSFKKSACLTCLAASHIRRRIRGETMSQTQDFDSNKQAKDAQAKGSRHIACESCRKQRCGSHATRVMICLTLMHRHHQQV